ncbi:hypothetical protein BN1088_1431394 [Sphingobacterium sp. PM2-P1-29]|nr:hypothetical protein BN1088_1431394 [Sphingobacterium sp. PM2-P1-29]
MISLDKGIAFIKYSLLEIYTIHHICSGQVIGAYQNDKI